MAQLVSLRLVDVGVTLGAGLMLTVEPTRSLPLHCAQAGSRGRSRARSLAAAIGLLALAASGAACNAPGSKSRDGGAVVDLRQDTPVTSGGGGGGGAGGSGAGGGNVLGADDGASCANAAACKSG